MVIFVHHKRQIWLLLLRCSILVSDKLEFKEKKRLKGIKRIQLEIIVLSEVSHKEKDK